MSKELGHLLRVSGLRSQKLTLFHILLAVEDLGKQF